MRNALAVPLILGLLTMGAATGAPSGLAVGEKIEAFLVKNCDGGDPYCQVCKYGKRPKLISVGDLDDPAWIQDLKAIQTLHERYSHVGDKSNTVKYNAVFASDRQAEQLSELEGVLKNNL